MSKYRGENKNLRARVFGDEDILTTSEFIGGADSLVEKVFGNYYDEFTGAEHESLKATIFGESIEGDLYRGDDLNLRARILGNTYPHGDFAHPNSFATRVFGVRDPKNYDGVNLNSLSEKVFGVDEGKFDGSVDQSLKATIFGEDATMSTFNSFDKNLRARVFGSEIVLNDTNWVTGESLRERIYREIDVAYGAIVVDTSNPDTLQYNIDSESGDVIFHKDFWLSVDDPMKILSNQVVLDFAGHFVRGARVGGNVENREIIDFQGTGFHTIKNVVLEDFDDAFIKMTNGGTLFFGDNTTINIMHDIQLMRNWIISTNSQEKVVINAHNHEIDLNGYNIAGFNFILQNALIKGWSSSSVTAEFASKKCILKNCTIYLDDDIDFGDGGVEIFGNVSFVGGGNIVSFTFD